jgi:hypothetical protein
MKIIEKYVSPIIVFGTFLLLVYGVFFEPILNSRKRSDEIQFKQLKEEIKELRSDFNNFRKEIRDKLFVPKLGAFAVPDSVWRVQGVKGYNRPPLGNEYLQATPN